MSDTDETGAPQVHVREVPLAPTTGSFAPAPAYAQAPAFSQGPAPEMRFFLPSGPPLPRKDWQHRWKIGIRVGSILVAVILVAIGITAAIVGLSTTSKFTAAGAVEVSCDTRSRPFVPDLAPRSPVKILDAKSGETYGSTTLDKFTRLGSGVCLLGFQVDGIPVADLYTVEIGSSYRELASASSLQNGALLS